MTDHDLTAAGQAGRLDAGMSIVCVVVFGAVMSVFLVVGAPVLWLVKLAMNAGQPIVAAAFAINLPAIKAVRR